MNTPTTIKVEAATRALLKLIGVRTGERLYEVAWRLAVESATSQEVAIAEQAFVGRRKR